MNELFVRLFLCELHKAGFEDAAYDKEQDRVIISPAYSRLFVAREDNENLIYYNAESRHLISPVRHLVDTTNMMVSMWEQAAPMEIADVANFRKLLDCNGVVFAARDDGDRGLHFVTWIYTYNRQDVGNGHYTTCFRAAAQDFASRSGLIPKELTFEDAQLDLLRSTLAYRLENDEDLNVGDKQKIEDMLDGLEAVTEQKLT